MKVIVPGTMSTPLYKCANCGAIIHRLNLRCEYCSHWNVDPANPQDPPLAAVQAGRSSPAVQPVATPPVAPVVVAAPVVAAPVVAPEPPRRLFGSKPEIAPATPSVPERRAGALLKPGGSKQSTSGIGGRRAPAAEPETALLWDRGRKLFGGRTPPATNEDSEALGRIQAVMAVAYWVASSDDEDEMDGDEHDAIVESFAELLGDDADEDELENAIASWDEAIAEDEEAFLAEAVAAIGSGPMRRQALEIATVVAAADDDLSDAEEEALDELATALGFTDRESERIIKKALESIDE